MANWPALQFSVNNGDCVEAGSGPVVVGAGGYQGRREFSSAAWAVFTRGLKAAG